MCIARKDGVEQEAAGAGGAAVPQRHIGDGHLHAQQDPLQLPQIGWECGPVYVRASWRCAQWKSGVSSASCRRSEYTARTFTQSLIIMALYYMSSLCEVWGPGLTCSLLLLKPQLCCGVGRLGLIYARSQQWCWQVEGCSIRTHPLGRHIPPCQYAWGQSQIREHYPNTNACLLLYHRLSLCRAAGMWPRPQAAVRLPLRCVPRRRLGWHSAS